MTARCWLDVAHLPVVGRTATGVPALLDPTQPVQPVGDRPDGTVEVIGWSSARRTRARATVPAQALVVDCSHDGSPCAHRLAHSL